MSDSRDGPPWIVLYRLLRGHYSLRVMAMFLAAFEAVLELASFLMLCYSVSLLPALHQRA